MEIRDPIHGPIPVTPGEQAVIDSPWFQRLRRIKQLGFAELAFPGATHNRYLHSVGVMHLAGQAFDAVFRGADWLPAADRNRVRQVLRLAALCHDIGHAPLSHTSESLFPAIRELNLPLLKGADSQAQARHEHYTLKLLLDSDLADVIRTRFTDLSVLPEHVAALLHTEVDCDVDTFVVNGRDLQGVLSALVSGEVDVDRMDYLLRDSHYTGVSYGKFDYDWLLSHLTHHVADDGRVYLAVQDRAIYTFDDFLLSRYHMFLMVYFHSKVVCYDHMLRRFYQELPTGFQIPADPAGFLDWDDGAIYTALRQHRGSKWGRSILAGRPLKVIAERGPHARVDPIDGLEERLQASGLDYLRVTSEGALSKYRGKSDPGRAISVQIKPRVGAPHFIPLSEATRLYQRYDEAAVLERLYVHAEDREQVARWIVDLRQGGAQGDD